MILLKNDHSALRIGRRDGCSDDGQASGYETGTSLVICPFLTDKSQSPRRGDLEARSREFGFVKRLLYLFSVLVQAVPEIVRSLGPMIDNVSPAATACHDKVGAASQSRPRADLVGSRAAPCGGFIRNPGRTFLHLNDTVLSSRRAGAPRTGLDETHS